jgi:SAM-dependent methyltransferase
MGRNRRTGYSEDLAYIHHEGHGAFARDAAPGILQRLARHGIEQGLVVELGCGSGILSAILAGAGYEVLGIDISPAMVRLAREHAPGARFRVGSMFTAKLPRCDAVVSVGECVNYEFDPAIDYGMGRVGDGGGGAAHLAPLFQSVFGALAPGGLFIFDFLEPSRGLPRLASKERVEATWVVAAQTVEDADTRLLTRSITSYRKRGTLYRRTDEVHRLRLIPRSAVAWHLRQAGFRVVTGSAYGSFRLARNHAVAFARRPER